MRAWISRACITCRKTKPDIWKREIEREGDKETEIDKGIKKTDNFARGGREVKKGGRKRHETGKKKRTASQREVDESLSRR